MRHLRRGPLIARVGGISLLLAAFVGAGFQIVSSHKAAVSRTTGALVHQASMFSESVSQSAASARLALDIIEARFRGLYGGTEASGGDRKYLQGAAGGEPIPAAGMIDVAGQLILMGEAAVQNTSCRHPQNLLTWHQKRPSSEDRWSISQECIPGQQKIYLSRPVRDRRGAFVGVAFTVLATPGTLSPTPRGATPHAFETSLYLEDSGPIPLVSPGHRHNLRAAGFQARIRDAMRSGRAWADVDGTIFGLSGNTVAVALAPVARTPLYIAVEVSGNAALSEWRDHALALSLILLCFSAGTFGSLYVNLQEKRRHFDSKAKLDELVELKLKAEAANLAKSEYLAIMAHEIRTSMSGVLGMAEFMLKGKFYKEQHAGVKVIYESGQNLVQIINKILDFSKIESGTLELADVDFDPAELATRVGDLYSKEAHNKGLSLEIATPKDGALWVRGDELRIRQILANLVGNALKFTKSGTVTLALELDRSDANHVSLHYRVEDTGIGIAGEAQHDLFQPFNQAGMNVARDFGGTGLGLAICRRLSDLMGGRIWVESEIGKGSTFHFQVDVGRIGKPGAVEAELAVEVPEEPVSSRARILLAEDNLSNQKIAKMYLERDGYTVTCADDGRAAVDEFRKGTFDIILMDGSMPVMDGYEATRLIRVLEASEKRNRVPIIATTANTGESNELKCLDAGMDDFVPKPYRFSDLKVKIEWWARRERQETVGK